LKSIYIINIIYEHGDADATTYVVAKKKSEEELATFITKFKEYAKLIDENSGSKNLPLDFYDRIEKDDIPYEHDRYSDGLCLPIRVTPTPTRY